MTVTVAHHASGVDLTLRIPGLHPATIRAATLDAAVSCARSIVADERYKMNAMLDDIDAALRQMAEGRG